MKHQHTYQFVCPRCGEVNDIELTPLMLAGYTHDYVSCWNCNDFLHIALTDDDEIVATNYDEFTRQAIEQVKQELLWQR